MAESQRVRTWHELVESLQSYEGRCVWGCRGEAMRYKTCMPTIDRCTMQYQLDWEKRLAVECILMTRFIEQSPAHLEVYELSMLDGLSVLHLMRHFGAPTRLMDWSDSLWIAAYFAAADCPEEDAYVRFFDKYQLEDNVHAHFHNQTSTYAETVAVQFRYPGKVSKLFHAPTVQSDGWKTWLTCNYLRGGKFPRLLAQQGFFTLASKPYLDHWKLIQEMLALGDPGQGFGEIIIDRHAKPEILQGLASMGITAATLYPGLDGLGKSLSAFAQHSHLDIGVDNMLGRDWRREPGGPANWPSPPND